MEIKLFFRPVPTKRKVYFVPALISACQNGSLSTFYVRAIPWKPDRFCFLMRLWLMGGRAPSRPLGEAVAYVLMATTVAAACRLLPATIMLTQGLFIENFQAGPVIAMDGAGIGLNVFLRRMQHPSTYPISVHADKWFRRRKITFSCNYLSPAEALRFVCGSMSVCDDWVTDHAFIIKQRICAV